MLPLSDPGWRRFQSNYADGGHVAGILSRVEKGEPLDERSISDEVMEEWRSSAEAAVPLLLGLLAEHPESESDLCYLLCSLAAVHGYPELATAIEGLDAA